jgi:hypothetical protein
MITGKTFWRRNRRRSPVMRRAKLPDELGARDLPETSDVAEIVAVHSAPHDERGVHNRIFVGIEIDAADQMLPVPAIRIIGEYSP